jgi:hypothetical protein
VKRAFARRSELAAPHASQANVGASIARVQFIVPAAKDIASRVVFHFSGLGYRIVEERSSQWVFERGKSLAALWGTDIRTCKTTLNVSTITGDDGRVCVSCHWAVRTLGLQWVTRRDARKFEAEGRELELLLGGGVTDDVLGRSEPASLRQKLRGTLGRAWDDWWAERDRWFTNGVQVVLSVVFIVCLILYISFYTRSERLPETDGKRLRHTIVTFGVPDPWFKYETYPDTRTPFQWEIDWISTSTGIMLLGFVAWCANWQIEKAKAKLTGKQLRWWHGSPNFAIAIWGVFTLAAIVMGIALAELTQGQAQGAANKQLRPSEQEAEQNDEEKPPARAEAAQSKD